jgi:hypothetical protein
VPLKAQPDDYLFTNVRREPIRPEDFYDAFVDAQRVLGIRLRDLYSTKDTYISLSLMDGVHPDFVSQQTGVAESTLRKHYAKWIHTSDRDAVELAKIERKSVAKPEAKTG